ncbi:sigma-70 family RNA polymerase sigma factor [Lewinella lacunae]|uniref:Sigma-70 family RNA polymerase sigma factor n=2 Tax=Neolewinella lacunae TaxID=1517758 RepID=A0A923T971_9BACT|nr:sigma-70 family RNA polymerase sigma factor [Neolewinella lacunae]
MQAEDQSGVCAPSVFDATFLRVAPLLRNFLFYRTGDAESAADLVQEAFVRLWENCSKVLPDKARAWLFKVGENLFLQQVAKARVAGRYALEMVRTDEAQGESPEALLEEKEFAERLDAAIAALPEGSREVFLLNRIDGLKYREIADLLGISQKAVEKRMHRALVELRELHPGV